MQDNSFNLSDKISKWATNRYLNYKKPLYLLRLIANFLSETLGTVASGESAFSNKIQPCFHKENHLLEYFESLHNIKLITFSILFEIINGFNI